MPSSLSSISGYWTFAARMAPISASLLSVCGSLQILSSLLLVTFTSLAIFYLYPRQALVLGLRGCGLWAELKALNAQSQELEEAAGQRQLLLQELQAKQQRILHWRQLVVRSGTPGETTGPGRGPE